ncbi:hypothetical protein NL676_038772 [Syzygium grande]|nr:hypothetical protein NL676_038772 [Syzygium grande]
MPSCGCLMLQIKEKLLLQEYNNCIYSWRDVKQEGGGHCLFTVTTSFLNFIHKIEQLKCVITWELRVVGWEVIYGAEFVANSGGYLINIQKPKKMSLVDEPVVHGTFKVSELGKVLLTVDNPTSKKKLLYRFKIDLLGD